MLEKIKDGWLEKPVNKIILRLYKSQPHPSKMLIICINQIVKEDQEIDFIIKEKEILKVNEAVNLWRNLKLKGWKEIKTKI